MSYHSVEEMKQEFLENNEMAQRYNRALKVVLTFVLTFPFAGFSGLNPIFYMILVSNVVFLFLLLVNIGGIIQFETTIFEYTKNANDRDKLVKGQFIWSIKQVLVPLGIGIGFFFFSKLFLSTSSTIETIVPPISEIFLIFLNVGLFFLASYLISRWIILRFVEFSGETFETGALETNSRKFIPPVVIVILFWIVNIITVDLQLISLYKNRITPLFGDISANFLLSITSILLVFGNILAKLDGDDKLKNRNSWVQQ